MGLPFKVLHCLSWTLLNPSASSYRLGDQLKTRLEREQYLDLQQAKEAREILLAEKVIHKQEAGMNVGGGGPSTSAPIIRSYSFDSVSDFATKSRSSVVLQPPPHNRLSSSLLQKDNSSVIEEDFPANRSVGGVDMPMSVSSFDLNGEGMSRASSIMELIDDPFEQTPAPQVNEDAIEDPFEEKSTIKSKGASEDSFDKVTQTILDMVAWANDF